MPSSESVDDNQPSSFEASLNLQLTTYTTFVTGKGIKKKTVTKKDKPKNKAIQFTFFESEENYLLLLNRILEKFKLEGIYRVSENRVFPLKIHVPPQKARDATDIENATEYLEIASKVIKGQPTKDLTLYIDMMQVDTHAKKLKKRSKSGTGAAVDRDNESSESDNSDHADSAQEDEDDEDGLTPEQHREAKILRELDKRYKNTSDNSYTYKDSTTGIPVRLSNIAIEIWVRAIMAKTATFDKPPPNDVLFKPLPRLTHSDHRGRANHSGSPPTDDSVLGSVTSFLSAISNFTSNCSHNSRSRSRSHSRSRSRSRSYSHSKSRSYSQPRTPVAPGPSSSPIRNSPSKLPRFLEHAEKNLGIPYATLHRAVLEKAGYGPDILDLVSDDALTALGLTPGDAIRLKREAPIWWNGPLAKRKLDIADDTFPGPSKKPRVQFEKRWKDGSGAARYMGTLGETNGFDDDNDDCDWFFFSDATNSFLPVPRGYAAILNEDMDS
ncbi:hypothetical protein C8R42DRAFT_643309 [Lentinula raphanica]|nr:hypothetical protein C8R42DRAFT_643309 [Lentinula raphanica]